MKRRTFISLMSVMAAAGVLALAGCSSNSGSSAAASGAASSADMFFSQSLPPLFFPAEILRTGCWIPTRQPARIHLQYIILHPPAFVKDFLQKNFPQAFSTEIAENRRNCAVFAPPGFPQFPHPPHPGILCGNFREKS